jgi:hypothetical protein
MNKRMLTVVIALGGLLVPLAYAEKPPHGPRFGQEGAFESHDDSSPESHRSDREHTSLRKSVAFATVIAGRTGDFSARHVGVHRSD